MTRSGPLVLRIDLDEGKQFYVRRIEFQGNTTTRDKVIRRELALEEGQIYNGNLWELSLLRLNQLQYFEPLKPEQDSEIKQNAQDGTVDITLKVKEKGKNSIGLTGGVSGLAGAFIGINYTTNNLFGKGESLTLEFQIGQYQRNETLSFTQPYLFDRPLQFGWSVYHRSYNYNQAALTSQQYQQQIDLSDQLPGVTCRTSPRQSTGFTTSLSYPIKRSFKRVGITYWLRRLVADRRSVPLRQDYFEALEFRGISGPQRAERNHHQQDRSQLLVQQDRQSAASAQRAEPVLRQRNRGPGRQRQIRQAGRRVQEVHAGEQRPQHGGLPRAGFVDYRIRRTGRPPGRPLLHGRRHRHARLRYPRDLAGLVLPHVR